jgi:hypothetical protein
MFEPVPTVSLHIAPSQMWEVLRRLTTYLLQEEYAFLQTFHNGQYTELEIFQHSGLAAVRLTLHSTESVSPAGLPTGPTYEPALAGETTLFIKRLLEVCNPG